MKIKKQILFLVKINTLYFKLNQLEQNAIDKVVSGKKKGLIIISFGSQLKTTPIPDSIFNMILHMIMAEKNYEFIWNLGGSNLEKAKLHTKIANMHVDEWINQKELLGNFIKHLSLKLEKFLT